VNPDLPGVRRCADTGLFLVPATGQVTWRVGRTAYGPLSPQLRDHTMATGWNRFDIHHGRTLYTASTRECAYSEVLAALKKPHASPAAANKDAAFLGLDPATFAAQVATDWTTNHVAAPGIITDDHWRTQRTLWSLRLPLTGWWVRLEDPDSMAAAEKAIPTELATAGAPTLDVGVLRGSNRVATVLVADWVHGLRLDDGTQPLGIHYDSKHATGHSWAYWMPRPDDRTPPKHEPVQVVTEHPVERADPDLLTVTRRFGISLA